MNRLLRTAALALPVLATIIVACSDDAPSGDGSFTIALTVAGQGRVTSNPDGIDCEGPRDCGTQSYAAGTAITLVPTAAAGSSLASIVVDDVATTDRIIRGEAGTTKNVTITFAAGDATTVDGGGDGDASTGDGGAGCTTADSCGSTAVCCIRARSTASGFVPTGSSCESPDACRMNDDQGQAGYPVCSPPTDTRCTPVEACVASAQGSSTYVCVLPTL